MRVCGVPDGKGGWKKKPLRTAAKVEERYNKYIIPLVGDVAVKDFRIDPHYNKVIDPLVKRGKLRQAGVVHSDLTGLFSFAVTRGVDGIEHSPVSRAVSADPKNVRKRWLKPEEIKLVWPLLDVAFQRTVKGKRIATIAKLLLVQGQRSGEVGGARRPEFDWANMIWTIPGERTKNKRDHQVPISPLAAILWREAWRLSNSVWLFPNKKGTGPTTSAHIASAIFDANARETFPVLKWAAHDLRRTVGTEMLNRANGLGITKSIKYLILNHTSDDDETHDVSDRVYDMNTYLEEKREALDKWGAFLTRLVGEQALQREAA